MIEIKASMAGSVWQINVELGDRVKVGQDVVILESMKMEIPIAAEEAGIITELRVAEGDFVNEGDILTIIKID